MIARTLTGSVAEISAPKAKLSARLSDVMSSKIPPKLKIRDPIITADINVPTNAYIMIAPKLLKKGKLPKAQLPTSKKRINSSYLQSWRR